MTNNDNNNNNNTNNNNNNNNNNNISKVCLCLCLGCSNILFNPLSPNSDQHQLFPCNINPYSIPEVMRRKDMITQGEFS